LLAEANASAVFQKGKMQSTLNIALFAIYLVVRSNNPSLATSQNL